MTKFRIEADADTSRWMEYIATNPEIKEYAEELVLDSATLEEGWGDEDGATYYMDYSREDLADKLSERILVHLNNKGLALEEETPEFQSIINADWEAIVDNIANHVEEFFWEDEQFAADIRETEDSLRGPL